MNEREGLRRNTYTMRTHDKSVLQLHRLLKTLLFNKRHAFPLFACVLNQQSLNFLCDVFFFHSRNTAQARILLQKDLSLV